MKKLILLLGIAIFLTQFAFAQVGKDSELYKTIISKDKLLFDVGFNTCDIAQFESLLSDKFEIFHDKAGISDKKDFVNSFRNGLCKSPDTYQSRRELLAGSTEIYPLYNNDFLYGAIQTGIHRFHENISGKREVNRSTAKFTHVWQLEDGKWKLTKSLSYDHQLPTTDSLKVGDEMDEIFTPNIGGIKQAIEIKTDDDSKPVLLFLSGGPGSSMMNSAENFTDKLRNKFTIVQWDQRDAGKTLALNPSPNKPTINQMQTDTYEVIQFVTKKLNKEKIYLAGSSFGNVLGFYIAEKHPEALHAYLAMNPVINSLESEKQLLKKLKNVYKKENNKTAIAELDSVKIPFENATDLLYVRRWLFVMDGNKSAATDGFKKGFLNWSETWFPAIQEIMQMNLQSTLKEVKVSIYFFVGKDDIQTSTKITKEYFNDLKAPKKDLYLFEKSAHSVHKTEPDKLQNIIIEKILRDNSETFSASKNLSASIDSMLSEQYNYGKFNGNVLVYRKGKKLYENSYGFADGSKTTLLNKDFRFNIGSIYKEFPAVAIMQLEEKNLVDLDDKLSKFFPKLPSWSKEVSIKHLLQYSSGLPRINFGAYFSNDLSISDAAIMNDVQNIKELEFKPGTDYLYTNFSPILLTKIVESVTKQKFTEYAEKNLFEFYKINNTLVKDQFPYKDKNVMAIPFNAEFKEDNFKIKYSSVLFVSTAEDLYKWFENLDSFKILNKQSVKFLSETAKTGDNIQSPLGNAVWENDKFIEHTHHGSSANYEGIVRRFGEDKLTIVILTNQKNDNVHELSDKIRTIINGKR